MKIAIIDSYYPDFISSWQLDKSATYEHELQRLLNFSFGTADFYSRNLRVLGWDAIDIIANYEDLQHKWAEFKDHHSSSIILLAQIENFRPDVVFCQDLSIFSANTLASLRQKYLLAGQCSCQLPDLEKVAQFDMLFTSFPFYIQRFQELGVKGVYLPLAFEPDVLARIGYRAQERDIDCLFVGGIGWQWKESLPLLEKLAREIPGIQFWGYGYENLSRDNPIRQQYFGTAWGLDYYRLLSRAKIVFNRHGAIARNYANNLRMFEATGCGALLLTEQKDNLGDFFRLTEVVAYSDTALISETIRYCLEFWNEDIGKRAQAGQARTLSSHTYSNRMSIVSDVLTECLKSQRIIVN